MKVKKANHIFGGEMIDEKLIGIKSFRFYFFPHLDFIFQCRKKIINIYFLNNSTLSKKQLVSQWYKNSSKNKQFKNTQKNVSNKSQCIIRPGVPFICQVTSNIIDLWKENAARLCCLYRFSSHCEHWIAIDTQISNNFSLFK